MKSSSISHVWENKCLNLHPADVVVHAYNPSTQEAVNGDLDIKTRLGYKRPCHSYVYMNVPDPPLPPTWIWLFPYALLIIQSKHLTTTTLYFYRWPATGILCPNRLRILICLFANINWLTHASWHTLYREQQLLLVPSQTERLAALHPSPITSMCNHSWGTYFIGLL